MRQKLLNSFRLRVVMLVAILCSAFTGTVWATDVTDKLNNTDFTASSTSYSTFSNVTKNTAVYGGRTSVQNSSVGMKRDTSNGAGIFTTTSGGVAKSLTFTWTSTTSRTLQVYGKNTAYSLADTKDTNNFGTLIASVAYDSNNTSPTLTLNSNTEYEYILIIPSSTSMLSVKDIEITWEVSDGSTPSISAENVSIAYDATSGNIVSTISNEPDPAGTLTATIADGATISGLSIGTITGTTVPFTCSANTSPGERTATVQLTYTYNTDQTVTKNVTITQAGNPDAYDNISSINSASTQYAVKGTVVAVSGRAFVLGDGTGYVYYYNGYTAPSVSVNDKKTITGTTSSYGNIVQFPNSATVADSETSNYDGNPAATVITAIPDYTSGLHLSDYFQFEGTLTKSSGYYYVSCGEGNINIAYPSTAQQTAMNALENKTVRVKGYFAGINSSSYFSMLLESIEEVVTDDPTITVSPSTLSSFTYEEGNGPSSEETFTVSGANLTANISLSLGDNSDFEISTTSGSGFGSSVNLASDASDEVVYVRLKSDLAVGSYDGTVTLTSTDAADVTVSLSGSVTAPEAAHVTWDLSTDQTTTATTGEMTWTSSYASMEVAKGSSSTNTNNYYPGTSGKSYTSTRFYSGSNLTITPASGYAITSVVFTATSTNYASALQGSTWTNASASVDGSTVTVTPTNGASAISAAIGGTCGFTQVKVYYVVDNTPTIAVDPTSINANCTETEGTITVTYTNIADNSSAAVYFCNSEGVSANYDWIDAEINNDKNVYYIISANNSTERTAYMKVKVGDVYSQLITITQAAYVAAPYYLATSITSGKHYVIASGTSGAVCVMSTQNTNNRTYVDGTVTGTGLDFETGVTPTEVVIYGPDADGYYTIYDATYDSNNGGYLYAASSGSNYLKTQTTNDNNGRWAITFNNDVASITAQGTNTRNVMQFNSSSSLFACYASASQSDVYLYEKDGDTPVTTTVSVTLNAKGYATFASTSTLDFLDADDATFSAWQISAISGTDITFTQIKETVAAGTGILLKGNAGATINLNILPVGGATLSGNKLEGITVATDIAANQYYGLSGNTFVKVKAGTIPAGKALLPASAVNGSGARLTFVFDDGETTTGISNVNVNSNDNWYDLQGRRVAQPQKGLYIMNGKKVVIK